MATGTPATSTAATSVVTTRPQWIVQGLLAFIFLFAGGAKLVMSTEQMLAQMKPPPPESVLPFIGPFLKFIGVCEVLGAIGLILPGCGIRPGLTPLAAAGLHDHHDRCDSRQPDGRWYAPALLTAVLGLLAAFVARSHWSRS